MTKVINNITPANSTTATYDGKANITVTCNDGYKFEKAPSMSYNSMWGELINVTLTLSSDGKTASDGVALYNEEPDGDITVSGETVSVGGGTTTPKGITVTNNIANTTETHDYTEGKATITIKSDYNLTYRLFNVKATYTENGEQKSVDLATSVSNGNSVATATFEVPDGTQITVTGELRHVVMITKNLTNCTGDISDYYELGATINITLKANTGTQFAKDTAAQLIYNDYGMITSVNMKLSDDRTTATITDTIPSGIDNVTIYGNCSVVAPVGDDYGAINVYVVTLENLKSFANVRFISTQEGTVVYHDLGKYVNRIKRIYTNVEKGATDVIRCANYNTKVSVFQPTKNKITLDFGNVVVPSHNNDNTDYESTVKLFIPFVGFVDVSNDYMGETLNLQIDINVVTGNGLYRLLYNDTVIQTGDCTPSQDVLYKTADMELTKIGGDDWNEQHYMGLEPYLFVKWYEGVNSGRNNDIHTCVISDLTGFNVFDDVTPIHTPEMLTEEQDLIYRALSDGVYI